MTNIGNSKKCSPSDEMLIFWCMVKYIAAQLPDTFKIILVKYLQQ